MTGSDRNVEPAPHSRRRAALFDMDRTLVRRETASLYVRYQFDSGKASWLDVAKTMYWVSRYTLGILDVERVADLVLAQLRGVDETELAARCEIWFTNYVEKYISPAGRAAVERHRAAGDLCAIVTGASPYAARPLARRLAIDHVVSTVFELDEWGRFTGRAEPPLCFGQGKVTRAEQLATSQGVRLEEATFYSDSVSDLPLLERVGEPVAINPDPRLSRIARRRGWRRERW
jgi:HAD superfamily hydrolase (TIGR01490 family)